MLNRSGHERSGPVSWHVEALIGGATMPVSVRSLQRSKRAAHASQPLRRRVDWRGFSAREAQTDRAPADARGSRVRSGREGSRVRSGREESRVGHGRKEKPRPPGQEGNGENAGHVPRIRTPGRSLSPTIPSNSTTRGHITPLTGGVISAWYCTGVGVGAGTGT